jgi:hypothetical protein
MIRRCENRQGYYKRISYDNYKKANIREANAKIYSNKRNRSLLFHFSIREAYRNVIRKADTEVKNNIRAFV